MGKLASVLAKKTQGDLDRVFKGTSKTRERLGYMDEVLALWRLDDLEDTLEELEETLLSVDFGPATSGRVLDAIRERVEGGEISTGAEVKAALKTAIVDILERANGFVAPHEQRHDHVRKHHNVAQRQDGIKVRIGIAHQDICLVSERCAHRENGNGPVAGRSLKVG